MPPFPQLPDWCPTDDHQKKPDNGIGISVSLSGLWRWWKNRNVQEDLDNIKSHEEFDEANTDQKHDD
jgi:hypothetical protein